MSGLHEAAYSLGNFTGPALAGLMYQKVRISLECVDSSGYLECVDSSRYLECVDSSRYL